VANGDRWQRLALGLAHIKDGAGAIFALVLRRERTETEPRSGRKKRFWVIDRPFPFGLIS
jgi:hypothetical protein